MRRRLLTSRHRVALEKEAVESLNQLGEIREELAPASSRPSALRDLALRHVCCSVRAWGKPSADLIGRGAFRELQAAHGCGGDPVTVAPLNLDLISLGGAGEPLDLSKLVADGCDEVHRFCEEYCLPTSAAEMALMQEGVPRLPHMDLSLRQPRQYERLILLFFEK